MKYIVYRGLRLRDEDEKMELTLTILSKNSSHVGMYCAPILQKKKPSLKQIERIWEGGVGVMFENTTRNKIYQFHTDIFYSPSWEEREKSIANFEAYNKTEKILPGHYEF